MKKRLILMLAAIGVFIATIGAIKYGQIKKGMAQQAAFQMPPETVTTVVAKSDAVAGDVELHRNGERRPGRDRQRRPAGDRLQDLLRVRKVRQRRRRPRPARHEAGSRRSSPPARRSGSSAVSTSTGCAS